MISIGNDISILSQDEAEFVPTLNFDGKQRDYLFSVSKDQQKKNKFFLHVDENQTAEETKNKDIFLIVRSLKLEDGTQKGYGLELGDIIRLGRIEYRVIEYQTHDFKISSLLNSSDQIKQAPFTMTVKDCNTENPVKNQCRICFMDETECSEVLVNPCNCKGTSEYVHIKCLQDWINSKAKRKVNEGATCFYWKKLNCEVCKVSLPDLVNVNNTKMELIPVYRPENAYILLERVFYDKTKINSETSKMMILLSLSSEDNQIKLGRGHECDLRENDISVSRLHAYIKYKEGKFTIYDNNSKFGTLVLLRKDYKIERKKIALQVGRTVITFALKHSSVNNVPVFKNPMLMEKLSKFNTPKHMHDNEAKSPVSFTDKQQENNLHGSFID